MNASRGLGRFISLASVILLGPVIAVALDDKVVVRSNQIFVVRYSSKEGRCWIPATNPPGQPHYEAIITVLLNGEEIATLPNGTYTATPCCDPADPLKQVEHALSVKAARDIEKALKIQADAGTSWTNVLKIAPQQQFTNAPWKKCVEQLVITNIFFAGSNFVPSAALGIDRNGFLTNPVPVVLWLNPEVYNWLGGRGQAEEKAAKLLEAIHQAAK